MRNSFLLCTAFLAVTLSASAQATVIADWNFEFGAVPTLFDSAVGSVVSASTGTGTFQGFHASNLSDWAGAPGNGSGGSYSGTVWTVGDYYQFSTATTGYESITISVDQSGAGGPRDFQLSFSTDGVNFTNFGSVYAVPRQSPAFLPWNETTRRTNAIFPFDLSGITALDDAATVYFRLTQVTNISTSGTVGTDGYGFIDNVTVNGTAIVPEPSVGILSLLSLLGFLRRRRSDIASRVK